MNYQPKENDKLQATLGGGWNHFDNDHYGEIIWAQYASTSFPGQRYYFNTARNTDFNAYARATYQALPWLGAYADMQVRRISYKIDGVEDDQNNVTTRANYTFFNAKAGLTASLGHGQQLYASFAVGQSSCFARPMPTLRASKVVERSTSTVAILSQVSRRFALASARASQ